jgi:hypothetical protein
MGLSRGWWLGAALLATVVAALLVEPGDDEVIPAQAARKPSAERVTASVADAGMPKPRSDAAAIGLRRGAYASDAENPFPSHSWQPPPPPPPKPAPPSAPPLPFTYVGKLLDGDKTLVFLSQQQRNLVVRQGDTIDNLYRVEQVTPDRVEFVYLPLKQKQTITFGR